MTTTSRSLALAGGAALLVGVLGAGVAIGSGAPGRSTAGSRVATTGVATTGVATTGVTAATVSSAADSNADVVDATLAAFDQAGTADGTSLAVPGTNAPAPARLAQRIRRFARWNMLVHATMTVDRPGIGIQTYDLDRGTISGSSTSPLTIAEAGGSSVTVSTDASTRVRKGGKKAALADLASGDRVIVVSLAQASGAPKALLVLVPPVAGTTAAP